ncbi:hypothetical protein BWD08_09080 [Neisseria animaloris]|nr:hypothetical protein BWD08_09080 [Neisseria animaloris]
MAVSNKALFEKTMNDIGEQYDQGVKDFANWFLPKVFDFGDKFNDAVNPDTWRDFVKEKFDEAGKAWDEFQKDLGDWLLSNLLDWSDKLGDWLDLNHDGKYHIVDPLVLDLDGDGIETVGTQGYHGALFDHNKDGIRTATGWVSADDGLLVIDTNSDGLIDAQDEAFKQLRVWRDLNQDGISQENELFTLESLNIQSLNTAYQDVSTRLGNGNNLVQKGSYTLSDGQTREMGDVLLANGTLHSRYIDAVKLTEEQMQLPKQVA